MMRGFGVLCLLMLIGTAALVYHGCYSEGSFSSIPAAFMYHAYSSEGSLSSNAGMVSMGSNAMTSILKGRKLKESMDPPTPNEDEDRFDLEDYRPIDPVPSSKASIRTGPIQHGTPLMPYIPKPSPAPGKPQHSG